MVKEFNSSKIDEVMQIWLNTNIAAHDFIPKNHWTDNYEAVKAMLPNAEILIYEDGEIKGFIGIVEKNYIAGLFVSDKFQGCGIGSKLLEACKNRYPTLVLDVYVNNDKAVEFYNRHGFRIREEKVNSDTKEREYTMLWADKAIDKNMISLHPANKDDIPIIEVWLNKEYIKKWYGEPDEWLAEIRNDSGEFGWLNHYIVMYGYTPIGFCQFYDCSQTPAGFEWDNEPQGTFGIDYLIGEEAYLKRGLGSVIIQQLCRQIIALENPVQFIADPVPENAVSIKLLERNGFKLDPATGLYKLVII